jgi:hypothetical protein
MAQSDWNTDRVWVRAPNEGWTAAPSGTGPASASATATGPDRGALGRALNRQTEKLDPARPHGQQLGVAQRAVPGVRTVESYTHLRLIRESYDRQLT